MPWIHQIPVEKASGVLRAEFEKALQRAGRVWNIVHIMSLNPAVMRDSMRFYRSLMFGESPLSRAQREMLATVVSAALACHY
jgi:alkylhydroperoxidase family enzyme